jgi:hypothetical protein
LAFEADAQQRGELKIIKGGSKPFLQHIKKKKVFKHAHIHMYNGVSRGGRIIPIIKK